MVYSESVWVGEERGGKGGDGDGVVIVPTTSKKDEAPLGGVVALSGRLRKRGFV